ncbi:MAG: glycosyltransferase [Candidatus Omnitrophica bacterium]|nr:glycosyltransferase [Candidatus Omnitrophota bacterium]
MNIVMVTQFWFPDTLGGAGRYIHDLAAGLRARGHRITILTPRVPSAPREDTLDGLRIVRYGPLRSWWQVPGSLWRIRRLFDQLHREHAFDLVVIQQSLPAFPLLLDQRARRLPWVYHFQSPWAEESRVARPPHPLNGVRRLSLWARHRVEHHVLSMARCRVTLSESMKELLCALHGLPPATVTVVPACVALERFHPVPSRHPVRERLGLPQDRRMLLTVRNLVPRQNLDGLIQAMSRVVEERPDCLLLIGGSGPLAQPLQHVVASAGLQEHVRLVGVIPETDLPQWYQAADLFIMPSKALEGFGLATVEALACGTPVVGTPVGGTRELLSRLDPSLLCRDAGPEAMAAALLQTLARLSDPRLRQEWSSRCRAYAEQFSVGAMAERIEGLYARASRTRVLHVHTLPVISGSGLNTFSSMCGQRDAGFDVELACAAPMASSEAASRAKSRDAVPDAGDESLLDLVERQGLVAHRLRHMVWAIHPLHDLLVVVELWRLMRRRRYTIVHTHNSKAGFVGRLAARLAGVPVVIHTVHGFAFHAQEPWWKRRLYRVLERLAAGWCGRLIMISQPLIEWAVEAHIAPRDKMALIYSGIDVKTFQQPVDAAALRAGLGLRDGEFVVGEVAKLWEGKGHAVLLRAAASLTDRLPGLRLLIVGEGGLRPSLEQLAGELGIRERVIFTGFRSDVPALMQVVDVAVLPSFFEGMGRAVLEAQAAGRPVIASRVGGIPDLIADGASGILVEPGSVEQLADAIRRLHDQPALRSRLGEAARQAVGGRFDARTMVEQIIRLYHEELAKRKGVTP